MEERRSTRERRESVKAACETVCTTVTQLEGKMDTAISTSNLRLIQVEKGISNYVRFQRTVEAFITDSVARDDERKKFENLRAQEIKDALAAHYQAVSQETAHAAQETANLSCKISQRTLVASIWQLTLAVAAVMVAVFFGILSYKQLQHGELVPLKIFQSQQSNLEYSVSNRPRQSAATQRSTW